MNRPPPLLEKPVSKTEHEVSRDGGSVPLDSGTSLVDAVQTFDFAESVFDIPKEVTLHQRLKAVGHQLAFQLSEILDDVSDGTMSTQYVESKPHPISGISSQAIELSGERFKPVGSIYLSLTDDGIVVTQLAFQPGMGSSEYATDLRVALPNIEEIGVEAAKGSPSPR